MRSILKINKTTSHFDDHLRFDVIGVVPTIHFENHLRSDVAGAISLITELELKTTKRYFKCHQRVKEIFKMMETIFEFFFLS